MFTKFKSSDWKWLVPAIIIVVAVLILPQKCGACTLSASTEIKVENVDTIALYPNQIQSIFQKPSSTGKSMKYYVVYTYKGVQDITTTTKSVIDYVEICKDAKIEPRLALKIKDGLVVSIIKQKTKL